MGDMMKIDANYEVKIDNNAYVLCKKHIGTRGESKGKEISEPFAYYSGLEGCLKRYLDEILKEVGNLDDIPAAVYRVLEITKEAKETIDD